MNLDQLYHDVMWSPSASKAMKKRAIPALINAYGGVAQSRLHATGSVQGDVIRGQTDIATTGMRESGATERTNLTAAANEILEKMRQSGATQRVGMQEAGASKRQERGAELDVYKSKEDDRLQRNMMTDFRDVIGGGGDGSYSAEDIQSIIQEQFDTEQEKVSAAMESQRAEAQKKKGLAKKIADSLFSEEDTEYWAMPQ